MSKKLFIILIIVALTGSTFFFKKQIKNFFYLISSPTQKTFWRWQDKTSDFFSAFLKTGVLIKENEELSRQIQQLVQEKVSLQEFKKENQFLRKALDLGLEKDFELKAAEVIAKDISGNLLVNKGQNYQISVGMPVITAQKVLVGKISEVYQNFSKVVLITNKESSFDAKITVKDIAGVIRGVGDSGLIFDLVPQDKEVKEGDILATGSLSGIFPKDLLAGSVKTARRSDVEPFQHIEVIPAFNVRELERLFIIADF